MRLVPCVPFALAALSLATPGSAGAVETEALRRHVDHLASPELEGRLAGTDGARAAADYIAARLEALGARPLPGRSDFRLEFEFSAGSLDAGTRLHLAMWWWSRSASLWERR